MASRIPSGFVLLCFSVLLLLTACRTPSSGTKGAKPSKEADAQAQAAANDLEGEDFSPEAVERRTEAHARYATGVLYDWEEEPDRAAEEFYKAAVADPKNSELALEVAQRLMQNKQLDKAAEVLSKTASTSQASPSVYAMLGRVYSLLGKKDLAIGTTKTAISKMPNNIVGYRTLAQIYFQAKQRDDALKVLDQASKQQKVDASFLVELGELYAGLLRSGTNDVARTNALNALQRAAALEPSNPLLLQRLGDGFAVLGQSDKATQYYLKVLERYPSLPGLREKLVEMFLRKEDHKAATEQLEAIIRNNPTNPQYYYLLGSIAYEDKNPKKAVEFYNKALLLNPDFEQVYYDLAGEQINLNKPKEAIATLDKAREKFQGTFVNEFFTGMAYTRMKDFTNAVGHLTAAEVIARATDTNRLNHIFYYQLGAAYERGQRLEEAEKYLRKAISMSPDFSEGLNYLGYMWAEKGIKLAEAQEMIEKAVKLEPKNAAYLDSLAWVLYKAGKPAEALSPMLKAIEYTEEPDATVYDHLGDIYSALHKMDKAREAWKKAVSIEPSKAIQTKLDAGAATQATPR
ncbi:MAG TPA: tetratricopeptide repeat protein [Candidatus Saccharimonadales bacterium]|nr:tetratricopeptide repeat protein [Candidatus Saccharimonadales bacterium]